jgi:long-chain fatty acid transport protein
MKTHSKKILGAALAGSSLLTPAAAGAGFQLAERSASGLGRAFSGEASIAEDASVLASNPAAMVMLGGNWNYSVGATYINPNADATLYPTVTGGDLGPAVKDNDIAEEAIVPYLYLTHKITDDLSVGFGTFSTYGLKTNYSRSVASQVNTDYSEITTLTLNPSVGYRFNEMFSIGAGFNAVYGEGELTSRFVPIPGTMQGFPAFDLEGDDWGYGYNLGFLFSPTPSTRIGVSYRSEVEIELDGDYSLTGFPSGMGEVPIDLPASAEFSVAQDLNEKWTIHGDILWTDWSSFDRLDLETSLGTIPLSDNNWNDTFRYSLGATYRPNRCWTLRTGVAFDETPIDSADRTLRIPDGDRIWLSLGASYAMTETFSIDGGYSYVFIEDVALGQNDSPGGPGTPSTIGTRSKGEGHFHLFSLGVSGSF